MMKTMYNSIELGSFENKVSLPLKSADNEETSPTFNILWFKFRLENIGKAVHGNLSEERHELEEKRFGLRHLKRRRSLG